jgi:hypothetical protein
MVSIIDLYHSHYQQLIIEALDQESFLVNT